MAASRRRSEDVTFWTALRDDLRPRLKELRYSLHLLRKSLLAMIGLAIVLFFLVLAVIGPAIAPDRFIYNDREKNGPPAGRPLVLTNQSARVFSGSGWTDTAWLQNPDENLDHKDLWGLYARSDAVGDTLDMRRFDLTVYTDEIVSVGVNVQSNSTLGEPGSYLTVSMSWDNGTTWSPTKRTPLRFADNDGYWSFLDFTNATTWDHVKLDGTHLVVKMVHSLEVGYPPGGLGVDVLRVVVRFRGAYHALGTTVDGEDVLTGIILGARISVRIGIQVVLVATILGSILGALAGYYGGVIDEAIMRITDVFLSIPGLILALALAATLGRILPRLDTIVYALVIVYWPTYTRLVRGQALAVRENLYIEAARATGASEMRLVSRHILPNTLAPITVQSSLDIGSVVLVAAALSFLGIGAPAGTPEWGLMVSRGFAFFPNNWWQVTFSGLMIFLFVLGFNLIGDGARDILDPRLRR